MPLSLATEDQEVLFQTIIRKIPSISDSGRLQELVTLAVTLMLRRPEDQGLRRTLTRCVQNIFAQAPPPVSTDEMRAGMRRTARNCVEVLQAAKEHRLPRDILFPPRARPSRTAPPVRRQSPTVATTRWVVMAAAAAMVALGGALLWYGASTRGPSTFADANTFVSQVTAAAAGSGETTHLFGGPLRLVEEKGRATVVAEGIPPRVCAAAGWPLAHKGILTINGVTPSRVSSAIITELCNSEDGDASIRWTGK